MPRRPRLNLAGLPLHVIQRGNNRAACFFGEDDYRFYLHWLKAGADKQGCAVHAYALMTNHVHLLLSPEKPGAASALMQALGRRYVQYVNRFYKRSGTLWEGRFKASLVSAEEYLLRCYRYIELNPVRAGMVRDPSEYSWSSYRHHALGEANALVRDHELFRSLGREGAERQAAYRALFRSELDAEAVSEIGKSVNGGFPLGGKSFVKEVAAALGRRAVPGRPGRRKKQSAPGIEGEQTGFEF